MSVDRIRIRGGRSLQGSVDISGSKNASLPILAASILVDGPILLRNVPYLKDIDNMLRILGHLGVRHQRNPDGTLELEVRDRTMHQAPYDLVRTMRASFVVLGPLWARRRVGSVSYPGGCVFGHRPVDLHLKGLEGLGAIVHRQDGYVTLSGPVRGGTVFMGGNFGSTVLGTANVLLAATLASGTTFLESAAMEPEVVDLCEFLNACGARISGMGSHMLVIEGVDSLHGCEWTVIPDRIEAGTFLTGAVMTNSPVTVKLVRPLHLLAVLDRLRATGATIEVGTDFLRNIPTPSGNITAVDVTLRWTVEKYASSISNRSNPSRWIGTSAIALAGLWASHRYTSGTSEPTGRRARATASRPIGGNGDRCSRGTNAASAIAGTAQPHRRSRVMARPTSNARKSIAISASRSGSRRYWKPGTQRWSRW